MTRMHERAAPIVTTIFKGSQGVGSAAMPGSKHPAHYFSGDLPHSLSSWNGVDDLWVFAYGSLIWRPNFAWVERRRVTLRGYHRALCLWSHDHRGSPDVPGVVFGLNRGGSCPGVAYRVAAAHVPSTFKALWAREMREGAYVPRWVRCCGGQGCVQALAFLLNRRCTHYTGELAEDHLLSVIREAVGMSGRCLDYVLHTHAALHEHGIEDRGLCQLVHRLRDASQPVVPPVVSVRFPDSTSH